MSEIPPGVSPDLPEVDEHLVAPGTRYEIEDGRLVYVPPALEPHAELHARLGAILVAHRAEGFLVALDMLTRTSRIDDIAPDASVYPAARNPRTGGRQLEELAFEIASTESLGHAGARAAKLTTRGVRRVFVIDVSRGRVLEWSTELDAWGILDRATDIVDAALAIPIPVVALVDAARADGVIVRAFREKRHREFAAAHAEARAEGRVEGRLEGAAELVLHMLAARGLRVDAAETARIMAEGDLARLGRWAAAVAAAPDVATLLELA